MSLMTIVIWCAVLLACAGAILWAYMNVRARRIVSRLGGVPLLVAPGRSLGVDGRHRRVRRRGTVLVSAGGFYVQAGIFDPASRHGGLGTDRSFG